MQVFKRSVVSLLIASTTLMGFPITASADIISTEDALPTAAVSDHRDRVNHFLMRADVRQELQEQGLDANAALARVGAMSDAEVAQLANRINHAPAGGEVLGLLFTVFIILLVTDILGLTKVFPFTRSVRR